MIVKQITPTQKELVLDTLDIYKSNKYILHPFDSRTIDFFDSVSKKIVKNPELNRLPEMVALAFWIRKTNLHKLKLENDHLFNNANFKVSPIGRVFHICPTNVDTMFIYSLTVSLLMGNKNVLRLSTRMNASQITVLFDMLNDVLAMNEFEIFKEYVNIISYDHNADISNFISQHSNARIIWGGDNTIKTFRQFIPMPRTKDIVFADRVSVLCVKCEAYLNTTDAEKENFIKNFFNDAYTFDQKGCSSPQSIYFIGSEEEYQKCMNQMPLELSSKIESKFTIDLASVASLKLNQLVEDVMDANVQKTYGDNIVKFVEMNQEEAVNLHHTCGGGYFYVSRINSIAEIEPLVNVKLQTVSYYGLNDSEKTDLIAIANAEGIDRIVPMGKALEFSYIWDGYNLFDEISRKVYIE